MADQTDFTQIAADFAACLKSAAPRDNGAQSINDTGAAEEAAVAGPVAVKDQPDPLPGDDTEGSNAPLPQNGIDADTRSSDPLKSIEKLAEANIPAESEQDRNGANAVTGDLDAAEPMAEAGTNGGIFSGFPAAPHQHGEFTLPLCDLVIGETSDGGACDFDCGAGEPLLHAVLTPHNIAPIVVMKTGDLWHVIDGWARVEAFRAQFGNTANILVRVVEWDGTRNDALYARFAATFLTLKSRKIDKSILLYKFHIAWEVPQQILAARIGWTESRVTRELAAAEAFQEAPRFAKLHVKAGDPPIDYLYKVQQARSSAAEDDRAHPKRAPEKSAATKLDAKLEALLAKPERFATAEALAKLGIVKPNKTKATTQVGEVADEPVDLQAPEVINCVEDSGGEAVAMVEMGADDLPSIRLLIDTAAIDDRRKAEVRHLVHEALDRLLGF